MRYGSILLLILLISASGVNAQDMRSQLQLLANDLSKQIEVRGKKRVIVASFRNLKNQETDLGRYMADKFGIGIMQASKTLQLTDRSLLAQVLRDNKLGAERILDPKTIPTLGRLTGAEAVITGNYTVLDNSLDITARAIDLERGLTLAAVEGTVPRTPEINRLLGEIDSPESDPGIPPSIPNPGKDAITTMPEHQCVRLASSYGIVFFRNEMKEPIVLYSISGRESYHDKIIIPVGGDNYTPTLMVGYKEDVKSYEYTFYFVTTEGTKREGTLKLMIDACKSKTVVLTPRRLYLSK